MLKEYLKAQQRHRNRTKEFAAQCEQYGLAPMEMEALDNCNDKTMGDVAQILKVTLPEVTALSKKLIALKYVKYAQPNPKDRRVRGLKLTPKGEAVLEEAETWEFATEEAGNE